VWTEPLPQRRRRAATLIGLAAILIVAAGAVYLRPTPASQPTRPASRPAIDPLAVSGNPVTFDFVNPSMGWASLIYVDPSSQSAQFRVYRTTDGAQHWLQQLAGTSTFGHGFSPIKVQLFGQTNGFMTLAGTVDELHRTADGGASWEQLALPVSRVDGITFFDATHGWMVAYTGTGLPATQAHIYETADRGRTWQPLPDPPSDATNIGFRSPTDSWMGSSDVLVPHVYTSSDRGHSWHRHDLPSPAGRSWAIAGYHYFGTSIQLLPSAGAIASVEATRCPQASPPPASPPTVCLDPIAETFLFASADGGKTWRQVATPPGTIAYQDSIHWWSISANALFKSTDAGRSWKHMATTPTYLQFSELSIFDLRHAWASVFVMGGYGLAFTSDGGLHWTLAKVPQPT
jgi:photosystem II stability/assembly factor-like uncharacterized protein